MDAGCELGVTLGDEDVAGVAPGAFNLFSGREVAEVYEQELGKPAPEGFRNVRVHDLRHTYGRRA